VSYLVEQLPYCDLLRLSKNTRAWVMSTCLCSGCNTWTRNDALMDSLWRTSSSVHGSRASPSLTTRMSKRASTCSTNPTANTMPRPRARATRSSRPSRSMTSQSSMVDRCLWGGPRVTMLKPGWEQGQRRKMANRHLTSPTLSIPD
jgi:hypothetical protein